MKKADIIQIIAEGTGLTKVETSAVVDGFIASLSYALKKGDSIELRGFGTFRIADRRARKVRNLRTGEDILIPAHRVPVFRCSREFKNYINTPDDDQQPVK